VKIRNEKLGPARAKGRDIVRPYTTGMKPAVSRNPTLETQTERQQPDSQRRRGAKRRKEGGRGGWWRTKFQGDFEAKRGGKLTSPAEIS
jgi:hypothetical protein